MIRLSIASRGQTKPLGIPTINRSHPLAVSLMAAFVPGDTAGKLLEAVSGRIYSQTNSSVTPSQTKEGSSLLGVNLGSGGYYIAGANVNPSAQVTCFSRVTRLTDSAQRGRIFNTQDATGGHVGGYQLSWVGTGSGVYEFEVGSGGSQIFPQVASSAIGTPVSLMGTYDGANVKIYLNGLFGAQLALTGAIAVPTSNPIVHNYDNLGTPGTQNFPGHIHIIYIFNRALNAQEALTLHFAPYDLLLYPRELHTTSTIGLNIISSAALMEAADTISAIALEDMIASVALTENPDTILAVAAETYRLLGALIENGDLVVSHSAAFGMAAALMESGDTLAATAFLLSNVQPGKVYLKDVAATSLVISDMTAANVFVSDRSACNLTITDALA